jgi:tetratricopeptide (TPR) repeat protein
MKIGAERDIDAYLAILAIDDANVPAIEALAGLYLDHGDKYQAFELLKRAAGTLASRERYEDARRMYQAALELDLTSVEVTRGLADVCFELSDWPTAATNYLRTLTGTHESERPAIYHKLGLIKQAQGETKKAIEFLKWALVHDPEHRSALDAMAAIYESLKDWEQAAHYKQRAEQ